EERAQLVEIEAHAKGRTLCPKRPRWEAVHAPPRTLPHGLPHAPRGAGNRLRMRTAAREHSHEPFECEFVAIAAEARDAADARLGDARSPAKRLARVGVREVNFDTRQGDRGQRVEDRYRRVR